MLYDPENPIMPHIVEKKKETPEEFLKRLFESEEGDRTRREIEKRFYRTFKRKPYFDKEDSQ